MHICLERFDNLITPLFHYSIIPVATIPPTGRRAKNINRADNK